VDQSEQFAEVLSSLHLIQRQNDLILSKLDGIMSDLNQVQPGTFASVVTNALQDIAFVIKH
jgi:hypothetical protein